MSILNTSKTICKQYDIKPRRSKGQNFLVDEEVYKKIIVAANLNKNDIVLEVGSGLGFLTERLARAVKRVIAVELDDKIVRALQNRLKEQGIDNVQVVNEDILKFEIRNLKLWSKISNFQFPISNYKVVANLPYNITSIFLRKYLSSEIKPEAITLLLQKEVAERITAKPRTFRVERHDADKKTARKVRGKPGKMSLLAVSVQFYARPEIVEYVPKMAFWPEPEVDSAIVKIDVRLGFKTQPNINFEREFFRLVRIGFSSRRKMLKNNLAGGYRISQAEAGNRIKIAGFSEKIRAQELSVNDWNKLFDYFK